MSMENPEGISIRSIPEHESGSAFLWSGLSCYERSRKARLSTLHEDFIAVQAQICSMSVLHVDSPLILVSHPVLTDEMCGLVTPLISNPPGQDAPLFYEYERL